MQWEQPTLCTPPCLPRHDGWPPQPGARVDSSIGKLLVGYSVTAAGRVTDSLASWEDRDADKDTEPLHPMNLFVNRNSHSASIWENHLFYLLKLQLP